jgi:Janus/Ocnus family (Ocnus)
MNDLLSFLEFLGIEYSRSAGNVAQDLREWIEALGYTVTVTGGGRIDYCPSGKTVKVYGFSYGFGKGDHLYTSSLISKWSEGRLTVTHNNSEGLY